MSVPHLDDPLAEPDEVRADPHCPRRHHGHGHDVVVGLERTKVWLLLLFLSSLGRWLFSLISPSDERKQKSFSELTKLRSMVHTTLYRAGRPICRKILLCFSMRGARACLGSR